MYIFLIIIYIYAAYSLFRIGKKLDDHLNFLAWMPVVNDYYVIKLAKRPFWYWPLLYVPVINICFSYIVWRDIAKRFGMSFVFGLLMIIPVVNWFVIALYAFVFDSGMTLKKETYRTMTTDTLQPTVNDKSDGETL
jgi:hypothetical protein